MSLDVYLIDPNQEEDDNELYWANITHNLNKMAEEAGIYKALWHPEDIGAKHAKDIIEIVEEGLIDIIRRPGHYQKFNSPNGWGTYRHFIPFVAKYLIALKEHPEAIIVVSV